MLVRHLRDYRLIDTQNVFVEKIQLLLGHADLDHVDPYLEISRARLRQAFAEVL